MSEKHGEDSLADIDDSSESFETSVLLDKSFQFLSWSNLQYTSNQFAQILTFAHVRTTANLATVLFGIISRYSPLQFKTTIRQEARFVGNNVLKEVLQALFLQYQVNVDVVRVG